MTTTTTTTPRTETRRESLSTDFTLAPMTPEQRRRAALAVCDRSSDAGEAHLLLEALGLLDVPRRAAA
jgi:hypothetical protein